MSETQTIILIFPESEGRQPVEIDVHQGTSVKGLLEFLIGTVISVKTIHFLGCLLNGKEADRDTMLSDGDTVELYSAGTRV